MTRHTFTPRRMVGAAALGALALGLLPAGASAQVDPLEPIPIDGVCANASATSGFTDVDSSTHRAAIRCLEGAGIALGVDGGTTFQPEGTISRQQMASLVVRMIDTANANAVLPLVDLPDYDGSNEFADVAGGNVHLEAINRLEAAGIVLGGPGDLPATAFAPEQAVSRAQMASFLARSLSFLVNAPLEAEFNWFDDDEGLVHEPSIDVMAEYGIAVGDGYVTFSPRADLTRGQMAAFVARSLALLQDNGSITPLPAPAA